MTESTGREEDRGPRMQDADFSPDGKQLVTGSVEGVLALWDVESGRRLRVLLDPAGIEDANLTLSFVGYDEAELGFRLERLSEEMRRSSIMRLCFSADGRRLAVGAGNGVVVIWNTEICWGEVHCFRPYTTPISALQISPDARWLATGCSETGANTLRVWRMDGPQEVASSEAFSSDRMIGGVYAIAFSPDSRFVATGGWGFTGPIVPKIFELETGERAPTVLYDAFRSLCYSPDGTLLAGGSEFGNVSLGSLETEKTIFERAKVHAGIVSLIVFSPDGRRLISGGLDGRLKIWTVETGDLLAEHSLPGSVLACRFRDDGTMLIATAARGDDHPTIHRLTWDSP